MNRLMRIVLTGLLIALALPVRIVASAQSGMDIRVNQVSTLDTPNGMTLRVYFNFFNPQTGAPILDAQPATAQVSLLNTNTASPGEVKKPDVPIYISLVLDSSGSMSAAAAQLKSAAKQALSSPPDNAFFSVIQFDESIKLLQDFTQNISTVNYAIDQYKVNFKATCLYDAAYTAVETLSKAPTGRRAVILFTDGQDGNNSGGPCSKHSYQDLITLANQMQVPIDTIGLSYSTANINSTELHSMATNTGGFSAVGVQADLSKSFGTIMDALKAQWMVETTIYPIEGNNDASLSIVTQDNQTLTAPFSFTSSTTYAGPPSPVTADLSGLLYHPENSTYDIQLSLTSPDLVGYVKVSVWDKKSGSKVAEYVFNNPKDFNTFNVPTDQLTVGGDYELHIIAVSRKDNTPYPLVRDSQGNVSTELIHEFTFDPTSASPQVQIQSVAQQGNDLALTITTSNTSLIAGFDGWMIDENTNTRVANSDYELPALGTNGGKIVVPANANKIPDGKYTVVVEVLGQNHQVYSSAQYSGVVYKATRPSVVQNLWVALIASPIVFALIIVILLGLVGFFMFMSLRTKSMTGTPVLQGRLGEKLTGGRKDGAILPLAENEPIPARPQSPAPSGSGVPVAPSQPRAAVPSVVPAINPVKLSTPSGQEEGATVIAQQPVALKASLVVTRSAGDASLQGQQYDLNQFPFLIGRVEGNLVIKDANISRRHAQIGFDASARIYTLTDLNSSNGTRMNEQRLPPGQPVQLTRGATIELGPNVTLRFDLN